MRSSCSLVLWRGSSLGNTTAIPWLRTNELYAARTCERPSAAHLPACSCIFPFLDRTLKQASVYFVVSLRNSHMWPISRPQYGARRCVRAPDAELSNRDFIVHSTTGMSIYAVYFTYITGLVRSTLHGALFPAVHRGATARIHVLACASEAVSSSPFTNAVLQHHTLLVLYIRLYPHFPCDSQCRLRSRDIWIFTEPLTGA